MGTSRFYIAFIPFEFGLYEDFWRDYYDKSTIRLSRHSSFTINHTFVNLGIVRHNMAKSLANTTVSTTKAHRQNRDKGKCVGSIP